MTIPLALLAAVVGLWMIGQTINLMTLGGLTLAIGILVDESTVAIENMHTHLARQPNRALAVLRAGTEVAVPQFLAMLCVAAVFTPALFMVGPGRALFVPLALAVALSMAASYFLARTFVPVLAIWWLQARPGGEAPRTGGFDTWRDRYGRLMQQVLRIRWIAVGIYLAVALGLAALLGRAIGTEIFPRIDTGQLQMRDQGTGRHARGANRSHCSTNPRIPERAGRAGERSRVDWVRRCAADELPDQHDSSVDKRVS